MFQNRDQKNMRLLILRYPHFFMDRNPQVANAKQHKMLVLHGPARGLCMPQFMRLVAIFLLSIIFQMSSIVPKTFWVKKMKNKIFEQFEIFNVYNFHPFFPIMVSRAHAQESSRDVYIPSKCTKCKHQFMYHCTKHISNQRKNFQNKKF